MGAMMPRVPIIPKMPSHATICSHCRRQWRAGLGARAVQCRHSCSSPGRPAAGQEQASLAAAGTAVLASTTLAGSILRSAMKKSSNVSCAACTAWEGRQGKEISTGMGGFYPAASWPSTCEMTIRAMPMRFCSGVTVCTALPWLP